MRWKRPMKELILPLFHRDSGSSFTRRKQGLFLLVTYGRLLCHSLMNLICVCWLSGQCLTCLAWSDEVKTVKTSDEGTNTPCSTELFAHCSLVGSKVYFFWSPTEDYRATVRWIWFVFVDYQVSVWRVRCDLMRWKCPMKELSAELSSPSDALFSIANRVSVG